MGMKMSEQEKELQKRKSPPESSSRASPYPLHYLPMDEGAWISGLALSSGNSFMKLHSWQTRYSDGVGTSQWNVPIYISVSPVPEWGHPWEKMPLPGQALWWPLSFARLCMESVRPGDHAVSSHVRPGDHAVSSHGMSGRNLSKNATWKGFWSSGNLARRPFNWALFFVNLLQYYLNLILEASYSISMTQMDIILLKSKIKYALVD